MRTIIHLDKKYVSIWLTRLEAQDEKVCESLKPIFRDFKKQGYQVVVFESGTGELVELTKCLLENNAMH